MTLSTLDYSFIIVFLSLVLGIGVYVSKKSGKYSSGFFLSGRTMPWGLLGLSMVATTFSMDTSPFGYRYRKDEWYIRELGLVGIFDNRLTNRIRLRQALAEIHMGHRQFILKAYVEKFLRPLREVE